MIIMTWKIMDTIGYSSPQLLTYEVPYLLKCKMRFFYLNLVVKYVRSSQICI